MMRQMTKPRAVPNHIWICVNLEENKAGGSMGHQTTYLAPELLVSGEVTVMAKSLLEEC